MSSHRFEGVYGLYREVGDRMVYDCIKEVCLIKSKHFFNINPGLGGK